MANDPKSVRFDALRNAIYHSSRQGFFDTVSRIFSFLVVAGGTAAVADLGAAIGIPSAVFAAVAALGGLAQLVFDFGGKARTHEFLQRRFYELIAEISENMSPDEGDIARWQAVLNRLYAEEPPPMRALDAVAYNAAADSLGFKQKLRIGVSQSAFRHLLPFNGTSFPYESSDPNAERLSPS